jgi:hypothetical protein
LMLFFGQFNYGKKGILDQDHTRLFTFKALRKALISTGYEIVKEEGIPAPFPIALGRNRLSAALLAVNRLLIHLSRGLFAYQVAIVARPKPMLADLLGRAEREREDKLAARSR